MAEKRVESSDGVTVLLLARLAPVELGFPSCCPCGYGSS